MGHSLRRRALKRPYSARTILHTQRVFENALCPPYELGRKSHRLEASSTERAASCNVRRNAVHSNSDRHLWPVNSKAVPHGLKRASRRTRSRSSNAPRKFKAAASAILSFPPHRKPPTGPSNARILS